MLSDRYLVLTDVGPKVSSAGQLGQARQTRQARPGLAGGSQTGTEVRSSLEPGPLWIGFAILTGTCQSVNDVTAALCHEASLAPCPLADGPLSLAPAPWAEKSIQIMARCIFRFGRPVPRENCCFYFFSSLGASADESVLSPGGPAALGGLVITEMPANETTQFFQPNLHRHRTHLHV